MRYLIFLITALLWSLPVSAQRYPERRLVRQGNRAFEQEKYDRSIDRYREAAEVTPDCWEATYNLGNALYRTEQYDKAAEALQRVAADSLRSTSERARAWYNLGEVQFKQEKLQEALQSFRSALRLDPEDEEARFNYVYVKRLIQQQEQNQDQQQDQQQQDQQQDQQNPNQQQNPDQQPQDQQGDPQEQEGQPNEADAPNEQPEQPQPTQGQISEQELEQMLEAIQAQEDETQEKLKEKRGVILQGGKNW